MPQDLALDLDALNEASQALYDLAFRRGDQHGREQATHDCAKRHALDVLERVELVLRLAVDLDDEHDRRRAAQIARSMLGMVPLLASVETYRAIDAVGRRGGVDPSAEQLIEAIAATQLAREAVGEVARDAA